MSSRCAQCLTQCLTQYLTQFISHSLSQCRTQCLILILIIVIVIIQCVYNHTQHLSARPRPRQGVLQSLRWNHVGGVRFL
jgi:hypothetical protein